MRRLHLATAFLVMAVLPAAGQAQSTPFAVVDAAPVAPSAPAAQLAAHAGSPVLFAPAARPLEVTGEAAPVVQATRRRNQRGVPLMIIGGAAFVAGAIVGGDAGTILVLGGAGVAAWGAYVYFSG